MRYAAELQPLAAEFRRVEAAIQALETADGASKPPRTSAKVRATGKRRGRPRKGEPTRADQFVALVKEQPGIKISEAAKEMSVQPTSLYRVVSKLEGEGAIRRDGTGLVPREGAVQEFSASDPS